MSESFFIIILSVLLLFSSIYIYRFYGKHHILVSLLLLITEILVLALTLFWLGCYFFTGEGITQAVIYTLTRSLTGVGIGSYWLPATLCGALLLILPALSFICFLRKKTNGGSGYFTLLSVVAAFIAVIISPTFSQLKNYDAPPPEVDGSDFSRYLITPEKKIANPQYNLVYIYGESFERTYFDAHVFPDLLPDLMPITQRGIDWSGTEQFPGTDFTIAGLLSSQCGLPLFSPTGVNGERVPEFFPNVTCLGDILKNSGYETWFIQGADLHFADKNKFFQTHGIEHTWGLKESERENANLQQNEWGLYDDEVMDKVWRQFQELSQAKMPFALFTLTLDTHPPKGYLSPGCHKEPYRKKGAESQGLTAVLCSQQAIAQLIHRIQSSPWAKNTVIVVSSDHLLMPNMSLAVDYLNKMPRANMFVLLKEGMKPQIIADKRSTLDNGATVLEALGGGSAIGLGRSSLSQPSLVTRFPNFKDKLLAWGPAIRDMWSDKD